MYEIEENKYVVNQSDNYCFACLSSDRNLTRYDDLEQYDDIFNNITNIGIRMPQEVSLCWECAAILKKIKLFKHRVENAQRLLLRYHILNEQKIPLETLSRLSITNTDNIICITHDDNDDNKPEITIKEEINDSDEPYNQEEPSNHCIEEIKKEKPKIKLKRKVSHYRIVYGPNVLKKSLLRKKFSIQPEEVLTWLEREKDCGFYKSFKFKCNSCFHGFHCKEKLAKHISEYHYESVGSHKCPTCAVRLCSVVELRAHSVSHLRAYSCAACAYSCYSLRRLNAHIDTHKLVQCVYCDACFEDVRQFHEHFKTMHSVFLCDHCGKRCRSKYLLEKHMAYHYTTHACGQCPRQYKSRAALNKHLATKHCTSSPELSYCVRCDKQFDSVLLYRRHVLNSKAHAHETDKLNKKRISCPECNNTYSRQAYMMNHYRHVHAQQSKYYCTHCDRHFLNRTRYKDHMRFNHEGVKREKNKLCNICGRGFATNRILHNHILTHSGERPYECEYCSAKFTQKHSMLSHINYIHMKSKRRPNWRH